MLVYATLAQLGTTSTQLTYALLVGLPAAIVRGLTLALAVRDHSTITMGNANLVDNFAHYAPMASPVMSAHQLPSPLSTRNVSHVDKSYRAALPARLKTYV